MTSATRQPIQADHLTLQAGQVLVPKAEHGLYRLAHGLMEVYVVVDGRRVFIGSVAAGGLLLGLGSDWGRLEYRAVADSSVSTLPHTALPQLAAEPQFRERLTPALEQWALVLLEGVVRLAPKRPRLTIFRAGNRPAAETEMAIATSQGVLWVCGDGGPGHISFLDCQPIESGRFGAASPHAWLRVGAAVGLITVPTATLIDDPEWFSIVISVLETIVETTIALECRRADEARDQAAASDEQTKANLDTAFRRLRATLTHETVESINENDFSYVYSVLTGKRGDPKVKPADSPEFEHYAMRQECRVRQISLKGHWWATDLGPMAVTIGGDGRVAAVKMDWLGRYHLYVRHELPQRVDATVAARLDREAMILTQPLPNRALTAKDVIFAGLAICRMDLGTLILSALFAALLGLLIPLATGSIVDTFIPALEGHQIVLIGLGLLVAQVSISALQVGAAVARLRIDGRIAEFISGGLMDRVVRLPPSVLRAYTSVDLALRISSVDSVRLSITGVVMNALMSGISGLAGGVLLFFYSPLAAALAFGLVTLLAAVGVWSGNLQNKAVETGEAMTASVRGFTQQIIENMTVLRAFAAESRAFARWASNAAEQRRRGLASRTVDNVFNGAIAAYQVLALAAIFAVLGAPQEGQGVSTGAYMVFVTTFQSFLAAGAVLARSLVQALSIKPMLQRAEPLLKNTPEVPPSAKSPGELSGAVEVSNLSFLHANGQSILKSVSFRAPAGAFVAIVGPSGSGKSTLMSLLIGLERPSGGVILYDGLDLRGLDLVEVRRQIGVVRQNGRLFAGSLRDNIMGVHKGSVDDAFAAADLAGIGDEIRQMPMGMHTVVTEGASAFSGGQIQRILLAQAVVGNPKILLLDEATSALDNLTQAKITQNIFGLGATRIVVAHRLSTIQNADLILFLDRGEIIEAGSYSDLIEVNGAFAKFAAPQSI